MELSGYGYVCSTGETFDSIALELFGHEKYAAELLCANPEHCRTTVFRGGEKLYIPEVDVPSVDAELFMPAEAPWKE